jgi:DNA-binding NtrC family response regulator
MARVIVADDDGLVRWSLSQTLSREGYEVITAESPAQILAEIVRATVDVVVTDYLFPESDGVEVLRKIKTSMPKTHVIMITSYGSPRLERLVRDIGAFDYFDKPFEVKAVAGSVARALVTPERRRGPRA